MTDKSPTFPQILTGQGRQTIASYLEQELTGYRGNPFIEALPAIMTEDEVMAALPRDPPYDDAERYLPSHLRLHAIQNALQCFALLPVHIDLEQRFSRMIRAGYQMRNPIGRNFWRNLDETCKNLNLSTAVVPNTAHSTPLGFTTSGTSTERDLFACDRLKVSIGLPSSLGKLCNSLPLNNAYTIDRFIYQNTLYPLFSAFVSPQRAEGLRNDMIQSSGGVL